MRALRDGFPALRADEAIGAPNQYKSRFNIASYSSPVITYHGDDGDREIDLNDYILPPTPAVPRFLPIYQDRRYVNTLLAIIDQRAEKSRINRPSLDLLQRHIIFYRHFVDWCRTQGIYNLVDFDHDAASFFLAAYSSGGWNGALSVAARWDAAIEKVSSIGCEPAQAFHLTRHDGGRMQHLDSIKMQFWRPLIGWGGTLPISSEVRARLEELSTLPPGPNWLARRNSQVAPPTELSLRNALSFINEYCRLPASVDRPIYRISQSPNIDARRLAMTPSGRTQNLSIEEAALTITTALRVIYKLAPPLITLLADAKEQDLLKPKQHSANNDWLLQHPAHPQIEMVSGRSLRRWVSSGKYSKESTTWTVDQLIGVIQGACAVVIAAMNARRSREVCDPSRGIRAGDLILEDDELSIYRAVFYIEKTYCERHEFYVNRTTADAFRCLSSIKESTLPMGSSAQPAPSLFCCGRRSPDGIKNNYHFSFTVDEGKARSLASFLEFAYGSSSKAPPLRSHMFRRFFAILYFHRFDHPDLRALKQHLRHMDVAMTRVYVTDNSGRPLAEQIMQKIGASKTSVPLASYRASLDSGYDDLESIVKGVGKEKFRATINSVLAGAPSSGGFSRIVRSMYRKLVSMTDFSEVDAAEMLAERLENGGYSIHAMQHGQCQSPDRARSLRGRCEQSGIHAREHASAILCSTCAFHFHSPLHLMNVREELLELEADLSAGTLSGMEQLRAAHDAKNLRMLVDRLELEFGSAPVLNARFQNHDNV